MNPDQENKQPIPADGQLPLQTSDPLEEGKVYQSAADETIQPQPPSSKRKRFVVIAVALVMILAGISFLAFRLLGDLRLTIYDAQTYRLQVPAGYTYQPSGNRVRFVENGGDASTRSFVVVHILPHPEMPTDTTKQQLIERYEKQIPQLIGQSSDATEKIENIHTQRITHREKDAFRVTADIVKQDKHAKLDMLVVIGDMAVFMVGVAAHAEDTLLAEASNRIVTSLVLYEF